MQSEIIILGHANYPIGIKSVLEFVVGLEDNIYTYNLDDDNSLEQLENNLSKHINNQKVKIIFCDIPGGSPHQKAVELARKNASDTIITFAGVGTSFIIDVAVKALIVKIDSFTKLKSEVEKIYQDLARYSTYHKN